jgi:predicted cupin superfamily sugar epimerase
MNKEAEYWKLKLGLSELLGEGGYYKETYRSDKVITLQFEKNGERSISTLIYYLLDGNQFSALHKLRSDEIWHFYVGSSLTLYVIDKKGDLEHIKLGNNLEDGESFHVVVRAHCWFGAKVNNRSSYSLLGCVVSPGFDYKDYELGERKKLVEAYPQHRSIIEELTRIPDA